MSALDTFPGELLKDIDPSPPGPPGERTVLTHPPAISFLDTIPAELIKKILSESIPTESLRIFCLVAKRFVQPAQQQLFRCTLVVSEKACGNLCTILVAKPYLAQYVKSFGVVGDSDTARGGVAWTVTSINLPIVLPKLTSIKSLLVLNDRACKMHWNALQPSVKTAFEAAMSCPTLTSVTLANFVFLSPNELARLLGRAEASLEKVTFTALVQVPYIFSWLIPEANASPLPQISPKEVTILNDMAFFMTHMLFPAPTNPCPFINTSNIHTLNLEVVDMSTISSISGVFLCLPSLRTFHLAPSSLPLGALEPLNFQGCAQLTTVCIDFSKCSDGRPPNIQPSLSPLRCPIEWTHESLRTFAENSVQTLKLGFPPDIITQFTHGGLPPAPETSAGLKAYCLGCKYPKLTTLSFLLVLDFPALDAVEVFIGRPGAETRYRPALDIVQDYLEAAWKFAAKLTGEMDPVAEGKVTVTTTCNKYEPQRR